MDTVLKLQPAIWKNLNTRERIDILQIVCNIESHYLVATYFISGRGASMEVVNANRSSLSSEEFDVLMREIETYIKEHGGIL